MMQWISKHAPIYVFMCDTWIRETDLKCFYPKETYWESRDGEKVDYTKKTKVMKFGRNSNGMDSC